MCLLLTGVVASTRILQRSYGTGTVPAECESFCQDYVDTCESANAFIDDGPRGGDPGSRRLINGLEPDLVRLGESAFGTVDDCLDACAGYPRPYDPSTFVNAGFNDINSNSIGDTYWCRETHLKLAKNKGDAFAAQVHCSAASPSGGGICVNQGLGWDWSGLVGNDLEYSPLNGLGATAWELIRAGADTGRHLGYCQLYYNDLVADCTNAGIDNDSLSVALGLIPVTVEVIILSNNVGKPLMGSTTTTPDKGITTIADNIFQNLFCPGCIRSLIIDQGHVATLSTNSFAGLTNLEQLSLNLQPITALPTGLLDGLLYLREFTVYNTAAQPGLLTSLPSNLIFNNLFLQRLVISGHPSLKGVATNFFSNSDPLDLSILISLDFSNNGFVNSQFVPGTLANLGNLEYLDLSRNDFTAAESGTIANTWSLRRFSMYGNTQLTTFADDFFAGKYYLEVALLHDTKEIVVPLSLFTDAPNLISYTISEVAS